MKFPTSTKIGKVKGDQKVDRQCFISAMKIESPPKLSNQQQLQIADAEIEALRDEMKEITLVDPRESANTKPLEEVTPVFIHPDHPDRHDDWGRVKLRIARCFGGMFEKKL